MSTTITPTEQNIEINVNNDVIDINVTNEIVDVNATTQQIDINVAGAYPLPSSVLSVFGRTGVVVATEGDYTLTQLGDVTLSSPSNGQVLKYNGTNWVNGTDAGGITSIATTSPITGGTITSTGTIGITQATTSTDGFLSSSDWNTFNNKQGALTLTTTGTSGAATLVGTTLNIPQYTEQFVGTVTSVAASITGNAIGITGSPITSSGTLAFAFAGNATQYVRGDGALATLPTNGGGGGASVSYYLNGSINQGTIGGVTYYEMNKTPIIGAGTDFSRNTNGYIASFLTDANDPALLNIPAGNFNFETYFQASSGGGSPTFYVELYKYDGTTFTLIASNSTSPKLINDGTNIEAYFSALAVPQTTLTLTDRLAIRIYVTTAGRTITLHTENGHLCQVITTFTTGLTALNGLTAQVQYLATGTSGTDFNIASATATHTFNLPTASATNRGALSSSDWTTFNNKQNALTNPITGTGTSGQVAYFNGTSSLTSSATFAFTPTSQLLVNNSVTAASAIARGTNLTPTLTAAANNDVLVGLDVNPTFNVGAFTGLSRLSARFTGNVLMGQVPSSLIAYSYVPLTLSNNAVAALKTQLSLVNGGGSGGAGSAIDFFTYTDAGNGNPGLRIAGVDDGNFSGNFQVITKAQGGAGNGTLSTKFQLFGGTGNVLIQNGGTFTDAGFRLDVNGTARFSGLITGTDGATFGNSTSVTRGFGTATFTVGDGGTTNNSTIRISKNATGNAANIFFRNTSTDIGRIWLDNSDNISIVHTGNSTITIANTGTSIFGSITAASAIARGLNITSTLVAAANNDVLVGLDITPTFTNGAFTGVNNIGIRLSNVRGGFMWLGALQGNSGTGTQAYQFTTNDTTNVGTMIVSQRNASGSGTALFVQQLGTGLGLNVATGNTILGSATSTTHRLEVNGSGLFNGTLTAVPSLRVSGSITAASLAQGLFINPTLIASANNDALVGLDINPTFTNGAFTGVKNLSIRVGNSYGQYTSALGHGVELNTNVGILGSLDVGGDSSVLYLWRSGARSNGSAIGSAYTSPSFNHLYFGTPAGKQMVLVQSNGNLILQNGGTFTDAGFRLDVNGTARTGLLTINTATTNAYAINFPNNTSVYVDPSSQSNLMSGTGQVITWGSNGANIYALDTKPIFLSPYINNGVIISRTGGNGFYALTVNNNAVISSTGYQFAVKAGTLAPIVEFYNASSTLIYGFNTTDFRSSLPIKIGNQTAPVASAILQADSTTQGALFPRMTTTQKNAISSPATGLMVYDTTLNKLSVYTGAAWETVTSS
jgi:hypothetical protein